MKKNNTYIVLVTVQNRCHSESAVFLADEESLIIKVNCRKISEILRSSPTGESLKMTLLGMLNSYLFIGITNG